jgi:hypothetical protein
MIESKEYKKFIQDDIQKLKGLELEILPGALFYKKIGLKMAMLYAIIVGIPLLIMMAFRTDSVLTIEFYREDFLYLTILYIFVALLTLPKVSEYIVFKETIKPHLKLGAIIDAKFKFLFRVFSVLYALWVIFDTNYLFTMDFQHFGERMFTVMGGFILSAFITSVLFHMEVSRVGLVSVFEIISALRKDEKKDDTTKYLND